MESRELSPGRREVFAVLSCSLLLAPTAGRCAGDADFIPEASVWSHLLASKPLYPKPPSRLAPMDDIMEDAVNPCIQASGCCGVGYIQSSQRIKHNKQTNK